MTSGLLSKENILFFVIVGTIFLIIITVCFLIIRSFFRFIINIFKKIFHKDERDKRIGLDSGEDVEVVVKELQESKEERQKIEQAKVATATVSGPSVQYSQSAANSAKKETEISQEQKFEDKNQKEIEERLNKLKGETVEEEGIMKKINIPTQKVMGGSFIKTSDPEKQALEDKAKILKIEREKGKESIEANLSKFKKGHTEEKETLESRLPSRDDKDVDSLQSIKIPRAKKVEPEAPIKEGIQKSEVVLKGSTPIKGEEMVVKKHDIEKLKSALINESLEKDEDIEKRLKEGKKFVDKGFVKWIAKIIKRKKIEKDEEERIKKETVTVSSGLHNSELLYEKGKIEAAKRTLQEQNKGLMGGMFSGAKESNKSLTGNTSKMSIAEKRGSIVKDTSIFEGKGEISRTNLREKLEGSKMYEAERSVGLTLSPIERSNLEREVFSQNLGQNISKSDLKWGIKKLNDKMLGSKNMAEKGKIRKEIKFFKKIGGIK